MNEVLKVVLTAAAIWVSKHFVGQGQLFLQLQLNLDIVLHLKIAIQQKKNVSESGFEPEST